MGQTEQTDLTPEKPLSAWRCNHCQELMYNTDNRGRPAPGAPTPNFYNKDYQKVCFLCFCIGHNERFSNSYWLTLHYEWKREQEKKKTNNDKLSGNTDYLTGA